VEPTQASVDRLPGLYGGVRRPYIFARHAQHRRHGTANQRRVCVLRATFGKAARLSANDQPDPLLPEKGSFPGTASRLLLGGIVESRLAIRGTASGFALVSCLTARSLTLSSAASGQGVQGQEGDDDDRRRDSDDGDGGGGYDHTAILASLFGVESRRRASSRLPVFGGATVAEVGAYTASPGASPSGAARVSVEVARSTDGVTGPRTHWTRTAHGDHAIRSLKRSRRPRGHDWAERAARR
jgi:hypothetical protein